MGSIGGNKKSCQGLGQRGQQQHVGRMLQESVLSTNNSESRLVEQSAPTIGPEDQEAWKVLVDCQVSLPLAGLLKLVLRFTEKVATIIARNGSEKVSVNFTNPITGPTIMDKQSPRIKFIIHDQEVAGSIVDGGSGVNVISKWTCDRLSITKWEACPCWL